MLRKRLFYILAVLLTGLTGLMVPGEAAAPSQHLKFSLTRPQVRAEYTDTILPCARTFFTTLPQLFDHPSGSICHPAQ